MATKEGMPSRVIGAESYNQRRSIPEWNGEEYAWDIRERGQSPLETGLYILGTDHGDKIYLGAGDDTVFAGRGNDEIWVGNGRDTVTTNQGNDLIHVGAYGWGNWGGGTHPDDLDVITDFTLGEDKIILDDASVYENANVVDSVIYLEILDGNNHYHHVELDLANPNAAIGKDSSSLLHDIVQ